MRPTHGLALLCLFTACATVMPARFVAPAYDVRGARSLDATRWVWGSLRAEVTDARVTLASVALDGVILAAAETPSGWLFVDGRGRVSTARAFLATPSDLGAIPASEDLSCRASPGRITCLSDAVLWTTDGTAAPSSVDPGCGALLSAAFVDSRRGAVVCEGGVVSSTRDGGRSWTLSPTPHGEGFREIALDHGALIATAGERAARIGDDGALTEVDAPPAAYDARRSEVEPRIIAAASMRFAGHWERLITATPAQRRDGGDFVWVDPNRYFLAVFRQDDGAPRQGPDARFRPEQYEELAAWGDGLALSQHRSLLRATRGVEFSPVASLEGLRDLRLSDDGTHATAIGRCGGDSRDTLCALEGSRWRAVRLPATPSITLGMHGQIALVAVCADPAPSRVCNPVAVDTRDGAARALASDALEGALAPDGTAVLLTAPRGREDERREVALGALEGAITRHPLPRGALAVAFADRLRGVAVGATTDALWRTRDGAETWERLTVPERVLEPHTPLLEATPRDMASWSTPLAYQLHCDARRCQLTGRLSLVGWGPLESPRPLRFTASVAARRARPQSSVACEFDASDATPPQLPTHPSEGTDVLDEMPVAGGGLLRRRDLGLDHEEVSLVAVDGRVRWTRSFHFDGMHTSYAVRRWRLRGLAMREGVAGYAVESEGARPAVWFFPLDAPGGRPVELAALALTSLTPCGAPRRDAVTLRVVTPDAMPSLSLLRVTPGLGMGFGGSSYDPRVLTVVELRHGEACVREMRHVTPTSEGGVATLRVVDGRFEGSYVDGAGSHALRCTVE